MVYEVYGDESCGAEIVTFGTLILSEENIAKALETLNSVKAFYGAPDSFKLHCRILFSGDARKKTPLAHLDSGKILELYIKLFEELKSTSFQSVVAIADKSIFPDSLPSLEMKSDNLLDKPIYSQAQVLKEKQLSVFCAQGAALHIAKNWGAKNIRLWFDSEETRISWFGKNPQTQTAVDQCFIDIGPEHEPIQISALKAGNDKPELLQIADCIAYITQYTKSKKGRDLSSNISQKYRKLYRLIAPQELEFGTAPNGSLGLRVNNKHQSST